MSSWHDPSASRTVLKPLPALSMSTVRMFWSSPGMLPPPPHHCACRHPRRTLGPFSTRICRAPTMPPSTVNMYTHSHATPWLSLCFSTCCTLPFGFMVLSSPLSTALPYCALQLNLAGYLPVCGSWLSVIGPCASSFSDARIGPRHLSVSRVGLPTQPPVWGSQLKSPVWDFQLSLPCGALNLVSRVGLSTQPPMWGFQLRLPCGTTHFHPYHTESHLTDTLTACASIPHFWDSWIRKQVISPLYLSPSSFTLLRTPIPLLPYLLIVSFSYSTPTSPFTLPYHFLPYCAISIVADLLCLLTLPLCLLTFSHFSIPLPLLRRPLSPHRCPAPLLHSPASIHIP